MKRNARIIITGGAGFIGAAVARELCDSGFENVFIFDNLSAGTLESVPRGCRIIKGDIRRERDLALLPKKADYVFHLAAATSVEESFLRPCFYMENNVCGTAKLLNWALKNRVKKIAYASSGAVYGDVRDGALMEEGRAPNPNNIYGLTKLDGEYLLNIYKLTFGLSCVVLRYFNVFGEQQDYLSPYASVIPKFICQALKGREITVYGTGRQTRDFIHVQDIARATILAMEKGSGIYNVATGEQHSVNAIAREVRRRIRTKSRVVHLPPVPGDSMKDRGCNKRITALGWRPGKGFNDRLEQTICWYLENIRRERP